MAHELLTIHSAFLPIDGQGEGQSVGYHIVECVDCATSGDILDVDDFLLCLRERMGFVTPDGF